MYLVYSILPRIACTIGQHLNAIVCLVALFLGMFGIQYFVAWPRRSGEIGDQSNQKYHTEDLFKWAMFLLRHRQG